VGSARLHRRSRLGLAELAEADFLTFQRGSQPHVALLDLLRQARLEPRRVHAVSSISAMVQLAEGGFGIATLPRSAAQRLLPNRALRLLTTEPPLPPLPVYASWREDAALHQVEAVVRSALAFIAATEPAPKAKKHGARQTAKQDAPRPASKKSIV
jgi:DNA-binding transcriptional LysR family regulator